VTSRSRPAFYALAPGAWRDYVTLLHLPYTLWHLSYVAIGASLVPGLQADRLVWGLLAFFLAMGVGAHALDELNGRPLNTKIPSVVLVLMASISIAGATAIGVGAALAWTLWLVPFVVFGAFIAVAYTLELFGGFFHSDLWFALAWGAFPVLTAYVGAGGTLRVEAVLAAIFAAIFAALLSAAQRQLSTQVRNIRRRAREVSGTIAFNDGRVETIDELTLLAAPEAALRALTVSVVVLAAALVVLRLG
jgi:HAMP domain-containing protein